MPVEYWFPTPIYVSVLAQSEQEICHEELDKVIKKYSNNLDNPWGDKVKTNFTYRNTTNILLETEVTFNIFLQECKKFLHSLKLDSTIEIKESWFNVSEEGDFQHFHIHNDYDISGVYFFQTNGDDGDLVFNHPSLVNRYHKLTAGFDDKICYKPQVGKLVLFPSFLEHGVFHNTSKNKRISIAFNAKVSS